MVPDVPGTEEPLSLAGSPRSSTSGAHDVPSTSTPIKEVFFRDEILPESGRFLLYNLSIVKYLKNKNIKILFQFKVSFV